MSGMLNWLIEGVTLAGMANKFCIATKPDLDLQTLQEVSASSLCYKISLFFHRQVQCTLYWLSQDTQSIKYSICLFGHLGAAWMLFSQSTYGSSCSAQVFLLCWYVYSPDLQALPFKERCLHAFLLPFYAVMFRSKGNLLKQLHYLANHYNFY